MTTLSLLKDTQQSVEGEQSVTEEEEESRFILLSMTTLSLLKDTQQSVLEKQSVTEEEEQSKFILL